MTMQLISARDMTPATFDAYFDRLERFNIALEMAPPIAEHIITKFNTHNRHKSESQAEKWKREMLADRWKLNHQGIAFSEQRVLLDGQHRLWAVVMSGKTVPMRVFFNEPADTIVTIDSMRPRTNDENISLAGSMGQVSKGELATLRAMLAGLNTPCRMTAGEEAVLLAQHRDAVDFAHEILPASHFRGIATAVTRGVLARATYSVDLDKLRHFADVLRNGVPTGRDDQPITLLVKFLMSDGNRRRSGSEFRECYSKTERALSAYVQGERLGRLFAATKELFLLPNEPQPMTLALAS